MSERINWRVGNLAGDVYEANVTGMEIFAKKPRIEHIAKNSDLGCLGRSEIHIIHVPRYRHLDRVEVIQLRSSCGVIRQEETPKRAWRRRGIPLPRGAIRHFQHMHGDILGVRWIFVALKIAAVQGGNL